jgi:hypothetical protein
MSPVHTTVDTLIMLYFSYKYDAICTGFSYCEAITIMLIFSFMYAALTMLSTLIGATWHWARHLTSSI